MGRSDFGARPPVQSLRDSGHDLLLGVRPVVEDVGRSESHDGVAVEGHADVLLPVALALSGGRMPGITVELEAESIADEAVQGMVIHNRLRNHFYAPPRKTDARQ